MQPPLWALGIGVEAVSIEWFSVESLSALALYQV